ncbi:hypothetical protein [Gemmata sp.]|uniref:hypothetical protein n=1 Tax=Gemmata sp. TaxID=1914242 RepID=UPI003F6FE501
MARDPRFQCRYEDLRPGEPRFGRVAVLPWDAEIFGFPVGDCQLGDAAALLGARAEWLDALRDWAARTGVRLVSFGTGATDRPAIELLTRCGFILVDTSLHGELTGLLARTLPEPRFAFRPAKTVDVAAVERMAAAGFEFGRYHTDPLFPRALADQRYVHWVRNAFANRTADDQLSVLCEGAEVRGFFHFVTRGTRGEVRLLAASPPGKGYGRDLFANVLRVWQRSGVDAVGSKLSGANPASVNAHAAMGFRFTRASLTYHWHPTGAVV